MKVPTMSDHFSSLVIKFVRNRGSLSESETSQLLGSNTPRTHNALLALKRDIEVQFVAHEARLHDIRAECAKAALEYRMVEIQTDDRDEESRESFPPEIAENLFIARELRWKVRTTRFLHLIEDALREVDGSSVSSVLIDAIEKHRSEMESDAEDVDNDLYAIADVVKQSLSA